MNSSTIVSLRLALVVAAAATSLLTGCGLAETTAVAATEAEAAAQQAKEGKKMEEKVQHDLDAANQAAADARAKAEEASQ
jgi:hypothetical protein